MAAANAPLDRLLRRQRTLGWILSCVTLTTTVTFFAMMTLAAPLLSRVVFGRSITLANVLAVGLILMFLVSIAWFGQRASRIDEQLRNARSGR